MLPLLLVEEFKECIGYTLSLRAPAVCGVAVCKFNANSTFYATIRVSCVKLSSALN